MLWADSLGQKQLLLQLMATFDLVSEKLPPQGLVSNRKEMFYLTTHSTHFIYDYMASDIWLRTILIVKKETRCRHIGYSFRLTARVLLYAPSHRQDSTYHGLCYTSSGALAGTGNVTHQTSNFCNSNNNYTDSHWKCTVMFSFKVIQNMYNIEIPLILLHRFFIFFKLKTVLTSFNVNSKMHLRVKVVKM